MLVRVIGVLGVHTRDRLLCGGELGSRKARTVLGMVAVSPGHTTVDQITAALWGETPPRAPAANIATMVSRLRATLGAGVLAKNGAGYRLGDHVRVDLRQAADLVGSPADSSVAAAQHAVRLLEGEVLPDEPDAPWASLARAWHRGLLRRARHALALTALTAGEVAIAQSAAESATRADAFDETAHRMLMRAHHAAGEPARAVLAYERLRTTLATELGIDPSLPTRDLHLDILRDAQCLSTT